MKKIVYAVLAIIIVIGIIVVATIGFNVDTIYSNHREVKIFLGKDYNIEDVNKIDWVLDNIKIKTKYNVVGRLKTMLKVENLNGKELKFNLYGDGGKTLSKAFELLPQEVL